MNALMNDIFMAVECNDVKRLDELCRTGLSQHNISNIDDIRDNHRNTAFIVAAMCRFIEIMELLTKSYGANVNAVNIFGCSALMLASSSVIRSSSRSGNHDADAASACEVIEWLFRNGCDNYNASNSIGETVMTYASFSEDGDATLRTMLHFFRERDDINIIKAQDSSGLTALHLCAKLGYKKRALLLLSDRRCDKSILDANGLTAEMLARSSGYEDVANCIRDHELSIDYNKLSDKTLRFIMATMFLCFVNVNCAFG